MSDVEKNQELNSRLCSIDNKEGSVEYACDLAGRLRKRAEIRKKIPTRKSVMEGKPDRLADLLEEAAGVIECFVEIVGGVYGEEPRR